MNFEKFEIALVATNRERAWPGYQASATYTFVITDGFLKARAEVMLSDGCLEIIEKGGKNLRRPQSLLWNTFSLRGVTLSKPRSSFEFHTDTLNISQSMAAFAMDLDKLLAHRSAIR